MKFNHVVCGGTFDHFHEGHKQLLTACISRGRRVTIGVTSGAMAGHKAYSKSIESLAIRSKNVLDYVSKSNKYVSLVTLGDIYGPTLTDSSIDAIFVTNETLGGAKMINDKRVQIGMKPLSIVVVPYVYDEMGDKISSVRIRQGLIDRQGVSYYKYLISKDKHILPKSLREELRSPLGRVISSLDSIPRARILKMKGNPLEYDQVSHISVGDVVTYNLKKIGIPLSFSVIDGITQRKALNTAYIHSILEKERYSAPNKKGTIQRIAAKAIYRAIVLGHNKAIKQLVIEGEEDLLTLAVVLLSPLKWHVWYGQQGVGAVDICITEKKKRMVYNLLKRFD